MGEGQRGRELRTEAGRGGYCDIHMRWCGQGLGGRGGCESGWIWDAAHLF